MGKHAVKHTKSKNPTRRAFKAGAVSVAGLLVGGVLAPYNHSAMSAAHKVFEDVFLDAGSIIFIDGNAYPNGSTRMDTEITGQYQYETCTAPCTHLTAPASGTTFDFINNTAVYPGTLGLYNGIGAPSGNQSVADGQKAIAQQISALNPSPSNPVTVVAYSEGAVAASNEVVNYGPDSGVSFVLIADADRPNGGILARLPAGTYIPLLGITGGSATSSTGAPVVMVTQEYDGIADAPAYPLNLAADANAILGFVYLHGSYYPVNPNDPNDTVITTSPNGNMTDILVLAPMGDLPLFMPLAQLGVPQPILVALDPAVRAIIDTGYDRTSNPAQQVGFALLPPVSAWPGDVQSVVVGFVTTAQELPGAVIASLPSVPGVLVMAPLKTIAPLSTPQPANTLPVSPAVPKTQLVSQVQPAAQVQQNAVPSQTDSPAADVGQSTPPGPTTSPTNASTPGPSQTLPTLTIKPATVNMASGNKVTPASSTGGGTSSNGSNPVQGALTSVPNAIGSLAGSLMKGTSSHTPSGSHGKS